MSAFMPPFFAGLINNELIEPFYSELPRILAIAAGKPLCDSLTDFTKVKVGIIPHCFLDTDPRAMLNELRMWDRLSGQETTPWDLGFDQSGWFAPG